MWSFLVFGRLSLCFSGWVGLVSGVVFFVGSSSGEAVTQSDIDLYGRAAWADSGTAILISQFPVQ
jgi:hypothetical protein